VRRILTPIHSHHRWAVVITLHRQQLEVVDCFSKRRLAREACRDYQREQQREILYAMVGDDMTII
jgi:hypothetical protein